MFIFSFKASSVKILSALFICIAVGAFVVSLMPEAGYAVNVNKIPLHDTLSDISVKTSKGRIEYLETLGFAVEEKTLSSASVTVPETFDAATEKYNVIQKMQGFDLENYKGKKVNSYTYTVTSLPDGTNFGNDEILATLIIYKNKVIAADICSKSTGQVSGIIRTA